MVAYEADYSYKAAALDPRKVEAAVKQLQRSGVEKKTRDYLVRVVQAASE